MITNIDRVYD